MNKKLKSKCCNANLIVEGDTTNYYVCTKCGKPTDPASDEVKEHPDCKYEVLSDSSTGIEGIVEELYSEHHIFSHENGDNPCSSFYRKNKKTGSEKYIGNSKNYPDDTRCNCGAVEKREDIKKSYKKALKSHGQKMLARGREEEREAIIRLIENGYYDDKIGKGKGEYPPFELSAFADRPVYHNYIIDKIKARNPHK